MVLDTHVITNPISGERIVIHETGSGSGESQLAWELMLAPGGRVPSSHAHPAQEERFTVVSGRMRFRVGGHPILAGPGATVVVPPETVHSFANAGPETARVLVTTTPALQMRELLETAAAMAREQHAAGRWLPHLFDLALFMSDFEREVRAPYLPVGLVRLAMRAVARLARVGGRDSRYRRLRAGA
ncbi:cupin domain-containing protein [Rugosimonospora africana]|nr:cupin domain-containing protein [Rugosimonospora africana]